MKTTVFNVVKTLPVTRVDASDLVINSVAVKESEKEEITIKAYPSELNDFFVQNVPASSLSSANYEVRYMDSSSSRYGRHNADYVIFDMGAIIKVSSSLHSTEEDIRTAERMIKRILTEESSLIGVFCHDEYTTLSSPIINEIRTHVNNCGKNLYIMNITVPYNSVGVPIDCIKDAISCIINTRHKTNEHKKEYKSYGPSTKILKFMNPYLSSYDEDFVGIYDLSSTVYNLHKIKVKGIILK